MPIEVKNLTLDVSGNRFVICEECGERNDAGMHVDVAVTSCVGTVEYYSLCPAHAAELHRKLGEALGYTPTKLGVMVPPVEALVEWVKAGLVKSTNDEGIEEYFHDPFKFMIQKHSSISWYAYFQMGTCRSPNPQYSTCNTFLDRDAAIRHIAHKLRARFVEMLGVEEGNNHD